MELFFDRIKETSTTTGTGTFTLAGAVSGYQAFSYDGTSFDTYYCIVHTTLDEWEMGSGAYTLAGTTLARTTPMRSTNSDAAVNFSAGTKHVFIVTPANFIETLRTDLYAHASRHQAGGADAIKLDDLAAPDDNTDLNVSTSLHGLVPKAPNDTTKFLRGDATWAVPTGATVKPHIVFYPTDSEPPTTNYAQLNLRNLHPTLDFDGTTDEAAVFTGWLPTTYSGGGLTVELFVCFTSATSGTARFEASIERMDASSLDIDADSFASSQSAGGTAPGTTGQLIKITITFTSGAQMDSLAAGEMFRLKINRDPNGDTGTDDITTDAQLLAVVVRET